MKLLKYFATDGEDGEKIYTTTLLMTSDDLCEMKSKADELCSQMGCKPSAWVGRYAIPGSKEIKSNQDWVMNLENGAGFAIEQ